MTIRVAIVEDQRLLRELLAAVIAGQEDMVVVGQARDGREALELIHREQPDILLLDVHLPDAHGVTVAHSAAAIAPRMKVLAVSAHSDPSVVREMLDAGAAGYLVKSAALQELKVAVRTVMNNRRYISPELEPALAAPRTSDRRLGRRERQVLALVARGKRSSAIAAELGISPATVEVHRRNIMRKLELHSVAELTRFAVREGLIPP